MPMGLLQLRKILTNGFLMLKDMGESKGNSPKGKFTIKVSNGIFSGTTGAALADAMIYGLKFSLGILISIGLTLPFRDYLQPRLSGTQEIFFIASIFLLTLYTIHRLIKKQINLATKHSDLKFPPKKAWFYFSFFFLGINSLFFIIPFLVLNA